MLTVLAIAVSAGSLSVLVHDAVAEHRARRGAALRNPRTSARLHHSCPLS